MQAGGGQSAKAGGGGISEGDVAGGVASEKYQRRIISRSNQHRT